MNRQQKSRIRKWIKALKSKDYNQGQGYLFALKDDTPYHCCLGVAASIYAKENNLEPLENSKVAALGSDYHAPNGEFISQDVMDFYGLTESDPKVTIKDNGVKESVSLTTLNDHKSYTFKQIADVLKDNFL